MVEYKDSVRQASRSVSSSSFTDMDFTGKVVLITGASSGIGAATAKHFTKLGAQVVMTGRNADSLKKCGTECVGKQKPLLLLADVTKQEDNARVIEETIGKFGKLDVLVNNAGRGVFGSIETTSLDQLDDMLNINLKGAYHLTMLAVPHLIKSTGNIVNVSSITGLKPFPNSLAYCISKAALDQFTKVIALELAPKKVRVNSVNPGKGDSD